MEIRYRKKKRKMYEEVDREEEEKKKKKKKKKKKEKEKREKGRESGGVEGKEMKEGELVRGVGKKEGGKGKRKKER